MIGAGDFASIHEGLAETIDALAPIETPTILVPGNNETEDALREAAAGWDAATVLHGERNRDRRGRVLRPRRRDPGHALGLELRPRRRAAAAEMLAACPEGAVLVLHSPPRGHCDTNGAGDHFGSEALLRGDRGEAAAARGLRPHPRVLGLREPDRRDARPQPRADRDLDRAVAQPARRYWRWVTPGASTAPHLLEARAGGRLVEQPAPGAEQDRDDVEPHLVDEAGGDVLLDRLLRHRRSRRPSPPAAALASLERGLDPVGDEVEGRPALHLERLALMVGEDEDRDVEGRLLAPPPLPGVLAPGPGAAAEHVAAHQDRADVAVELLRRPRCWR